MIYRLGSTLKVLLKPPLKDQFLLAKILMTGRVELDSLSKARSLSATLVLDQRVTPIGRQKRTQSG